MDGGRGRSACAKAYAAAPPDCAPTGRRWIIGRSHATEVPLSSAPILTRRDLNRATLARQFLLERVTLDPVVAVERLAGLQAQTTHTWYVGLWGRLAPFDPTEVGRLLAERQLVRLALMRSTIHLVSAADALWMRPLMDGAVHRSLGGYARNLQGLDLDLVARAARATVEAEPLTATALGRRLAERWPDRDPASLAQVARARLGLVQIPPRGMWGRSGPAAHTTVERWLAKPLAPSPSPEALVLRYLSAFGPASVMDAQAWSGLTRLSDVFERLRPDLLRFAGEDGRELFDVPDAPRPGADAPAPARLLYDYDNLLLAHADRSRFHHPRIGAPPAWDREGPVPGTVMVDGVVRGTWVAVRERRAVRLAVRPLGRLLRAEIDEVTAEAAALLELVAPTAADRDVVIVRG